MTTSKQPGHSAVSMCRQCLFSRPGTTATSKTAGTPRPFLNLYVHSFVDKSLQQKHFSRQPLSPKKPEKSFTGTSKVIGPTDWDERITRSHGGSNRIPSFYATSYATAFCPDSTFTPVFKTGNYPDSGWTHEHVAQPHRKDPKARRELESTQTLSTPTVYSSTFQPPRHPECPKLNNFTPGVRAYYPDHGPEQLLLRQEKTVPPLPKTEYQSKIATKPGREWMATDRFYGKECHEDQQSAYLKGNNFHNLFIAPEMMEATVEDHGTGKTDYQCNFDGSKLKSNQASKVANLPRAGIAHAEKRSPYNGFEGAVWEKELPVRTHVQKPTEDPARWLTQNQATYTWKSWRDTEDTRCVNRPFGPPKTETSGFTQNQSFLRVTNHAQHQPTERSLPFTTL